MPRRNHRAKVKRRKPADFEQSAENLSYDEMARRLVRTGKVSANVIDPGRQVQGGDEQ